MGIEYFLIDAYTVAIDILFFLVVIFIFGNFLEYFLVKLFRIDKLYKEVPFLIRVNIKTILGISLILIFGSLASLFNTLNQLYVFLVTIMVSVGYLLIIFKNKKSYELKLNRNQTKILLIVLVVILGSTLRLSTFGLNGVIFPGDDVRGHSMLAELICLNNGFTETREPFEHQVAAYPPGFHMIVAFFSTMFGQLSTEVLTVFVCLVYSLVGLGFYFLAYSLSKSEVASFVSALSVLFLNGEISFIPLWGGVTFLLALYFTSTFLALIYFDVVNMGDFFHFVAGVAFVVSLITNTGLALLGIVFLIPFILKKFRSNPPSNVQAIETYLKSAVSSFLISSFVYFFLVLPLALPAIKSVLGLISPDLMVPRIRTDVSTYGADWFSLENFIPRVILNHGIFLTVSLTLSIPLFMILLCIYFKKKNLSLRPVLFSYFTVFSWVFILILFGINNPQGVFFLEFPLWDLFVPSRIFTFLLIPFCILAGLLFQDVFNITKQTLAIINRRRACVKHLKFAMIATFLVLTIIVCYMDVKTNQLMESIGRSRVAISTSDLDCFEWIRRNTGIEDRFLVETSDAGQYIPAFCDRPVVFPFTLMQYDSNYQNLKELVYLDPDKNDTLNLLYVLKIDYIFVGSKTTRSPFITFNATLLLASSHYYLAFNSGESFIFKVKLDAFERMEMQQGNWK